MKVPPGTRSGRVFRVSGQGVPKAGKQGDLLVTFEVDVPAKLSADEKAGPGGTCQGFPEGSGHKLREKLGAENE